jgi:hypothetical protein
VSILRLRSLIAFTGTRNITWEQKDVILWSIYEINVGIICACIPALRLIVIRALPTLISTIQGSTQRSSGRRSKTRSQATNENADTMGGVNSGKESVVVEPNTITYTRTFAVRHEENDDETDLVYMEDLSEHAARERRDSYTSELSL